MLSRVRVAINSIKPSHGSYKQISNLRVSKQITNLQSFSVIPKYTDEKKIKKTTNADIVKENYGLQKYMNKVFGYTGLGVGGSLGVAYVLPLLVDFSGTTFVAGIALTFGSIFGIAMESKKMTKTENYKGENYLVKYSEHPPLKIAGYIGLVAGMGIMISPLTTMCLIIDPMIIPKALVATSAVTGGAMWYTYNQPPNKLKSWGAPLYGTLFGFAGMGLLSVGSALIMGPNSFFDFWHQIDTYVGIPLFTGLVAYDTHVAIEDYKTDADEIKSATSIYLDVMNILIRIMEIMAKAKK